MDDLLEIVKALFLSLGFVFVIMLIFNEEL